MNLPLEVLIMIMEPLFASYCKTRFSSGALLEHHDPDLSFFAARRLSPAIRVAARKVFFLIIASCWEEIGVEAMEQRIEVEQGYAEELSQLQMFIEWSCRFCGSEQCGRRTFDYWRGREVQFICESGRKTHRQLVQGRTETPTNLLAIQTCDPE